MKICFFGNGESIHIKRWLEFFRDRGHEVHLITFVDADINGVFVHKLGNFDIKTGGGNWKYFLYVNKIKKILKSVKPDIISAHYITSYGTLAALTGFKPIVLTAWGTDILVTAKSNFFYRNITRFAINRSQLVTSESQFVTGEVKKLSKTETITVPMGVSKSLCSMERREKDDEIKILSLRALTKNSNVDVIVKAFYKVVKKFKDKKIKLIITNNGPEMDNIKKLVSDYGLENCVEMRGFVSREELVDLYLSGSVHISIPDSDSTSVTLLEAMACGIMNIVSDIPSNGEWIKDALNGIVLREIKNPDSLSICIEKALSDKKLKKDSMVKNRQIILKKAIWEDNMETVENEFKNLVKKYRGEKYECTTC